MNINEYKFNIGDEVITVEGERGKIIDICECEKCQNRGFCEPIWENDEGTKVYITNCDADFDFNGYYKIGKYYFNKQLRRDRVEEAIARHELIIAGLVKQLKTIEELENSGPYVRYFGETSFGWCKDPELNHVFLLQQQNYANELLKSRGYLFLNEVFDMLGFPRTQVGQICGWVYDLENPIGGNFVSFGLYDAANHEDVVRDTNVFRLNFNVAGSILERLEKE